MGEQPPVTIKIDMASHAQVFDARDKTSVALVIGPRRMTSLRPVQIVQVMELLHRRHPEIGMRLELPIKPRRSCLLCSNAQEIGVCITDEAVDVVSVAIRTVPVTVVAVSVMAITVMAVTMVTVLMVTVPGSEWPTPTHGTVFFIPGLKSKPEM
jgi:hypothetical protein